MQFLLIIYAAVVAALVIAELRENRKLQRIFKPLAAFGFCFIAIWVGYFNQTFDTFFWKAILAALIACGIGDVCLLSRDNPTLFKGGMAAFALGHIIYIFAISQLRLATDLITFVVLTIIGVLVLRWLKPNLPSDMRIPVFAYITIIILMVWLAVSSASWTLMEVFDVMALSGSANAKQMSHYLIAPTVLALAAILFAVSDMFVARDRFVSPSPKNALIITPIYFGAQALFAISPALIYPPAL